MELIVMKFDRIKLLCDEILSHFCIEIKTLISINHNQTIKNVSEINFSGSQQMMMINRFITSYLCIWWQQLTFLIRTYLHNNIHSSIFYWKASDSIEPTPICP